MPTLPELFQRLSAQVDEFKLISLKEKIMAAALPSARLTLDSSGKALQRSYILGSPMLPEDVSWPTNSEGWPLMQMAQIDLQDLQSGKVNESLPSSGQLNFFYDYGNRFEEADPLACQVIYTPEEKMVSQPKPQPIFPDAIIQKKIQKIASSTNNRVTLTPQDIKTEVLSEPVFILIEQELTIPNDSASELESLFLTRPTHRDPYWSTYRDLFFKFCVKRPVIRMFGYSDPIQHCMQKELAEQNSSSPKDWILLFQLDSHSGPGGWKWDDSGMLYFWIKRDDLALQDFTKVKFITQCM